MWLEENDFQKQHFCQTRELKLSEWIYEYRRKTIGISTKGEIEKVVGNK